MTDRRKLQAFHPFVRLNRLLESVEPGSTGFDNGGTLSLAVGEPQNQPPAWVADELARHAREWSRYPPGRGTPDYLAAAAAWLVRRYGFEPAMIDPARMILPVPGTREGLFFAALSTIPQEPGDARPVVLLPNPFYHVYAGAAVSAGAEPVFVPANEATGNLPDFASLPEETLTRTALAYYCSPSNPQGAAADLAELCRLIELARRHDFVLAFDECYTEIFLDGPPSGALQAVEKLGGSMDNLLIFHSLSKRSSAPGLRCGFVVGAPSAIDPLDAILRVGGAGVPLPVLAAGAALWREESHVEVNRTLYRSNFTIAERIFGNRYGYRAPAGGFFLWLKVGNGEAATLRLWREAGLRVLPGAYMSAGEPGPENPGTDYIRVALVYEPEVTDAALRRMADVL